MDSPRSIFHIKENITKQDHLNNFHHVTCTKQEMMIFI